MPRRGTYIAVCGPIGVGKTELARILATRLGATYVPEVFAENGFLGRLYQPGGIERWGLACEMSFLPHRFDQVQQIEMLLASGEDVVTDWVVHQNLIYSRITLSDEEFEVYEGVFQRLMRDVPVPDRLICLDAEVETLLLRIQSRGREMEAAIDPSYVRRLHEAYRRWRWQCPVKTAPQFLDTTDLPIPFHEEAKKLAVQMILGEEIREFSPEVAPLICRC